MFKTTLAALAFVAMMPLTATAHGPSRQKVTQTIEINAPADKVWAAIGNFQDMSWHPAIAKTEGSGDNGTGAKRKLTLKSGGTIEEALTSYKAEAKTFAYEITAVDVKTLPVSNYSSSIRVSGEGDPLGRNAGHEQGAASIAVGIAGMASILGNRPVDVAELIPLKPQARRLSELV